MHSLACIYTPSSVLSHSDGDLRQSRRSVPPDSPLVPSFVRLIQLPFAFFFVEKKKENAQQTLYFAHFFFVDHIFSTAWTLFFAVVWWAYTPHDGKRVVNSAAQEAIRLGAGVNHTMSDTQLAAAANILWHEEKGVAAAVIILSWLSKVRCSHNV